MPMQPGQEGVMMGMMQQGFPVYGQYPQYNMPYAMGPVNPQVRHIPSKQPSFLPSLYWDSGLRKEDFHFLGFHLRSLTQTLLGVMGLV
jgi:hypothetical protein